MLGSSKKNKMPSTTPKDQTSRKYQKRVKFVQSPPVESGHLSSMICQNSACRAIISKYDKFCKRCSCHICKKFDENKDPSLWFVCTADEGDKNSCELSCHLECLLKSKKAGGAKPESWLYLDGSYLCECGKVSSILGCWKRQLTIAKDTRCVDVLRERISFSHRLLKGTFKFKQLHEITQEAMEMLEKAFGPIIEVSPKKPKKKRGIVARDPVAIEVQSLCALAIQRANENVSALCATSLHYRAFKFNDVSINKTLNSDCKAPTFDLNVAPLLDLNEEITPPPIDTSAGINTDYVAAAAPLDNENTSPRSDGNKKKEVFYIEKTNENNNVSSDDKFDNCVKLIRKLERDGHIGWEFRRKFLTWFGLRSTEKNRRVVYAFIEAFSDNPSGLVDQLVDFFIDLNDC